MEGLRATRALIHTSNLRHNIEAVRKSIPDGVLICASVKANAYGHGFEAVSRIMRKAGVEYLGVATPWEGEQLRRIGDDGPVILYGPSSAEEIPVTVESGLQPMITDREYLEAFVSAVKESGGRSHRVHLKVDTGMGRVGCLPEEAPALARIITDSPFLELAGLATHFPVADSTDPEDMDFTRSQFSRLRELAAGLEQEGMSPGIIHAANSGGIALHGDSSIQGMMVRPGIALYGYGPDLPVDEPQRPVMEIRTKITGIKKVTGGTTVSYGRTWTAAEATWIATLPVGYADGYSRLLSNKAEVLIAGKRHPIAGTICMDQCMVNLGPETVVGLGDEAILFGPDPAGPDAEEIAGLMGTISYEVTCGIGPRVPRFYVD